MKKKESVFITLSVSQKIWLTLNSMKKPGESFDSVINRLIVGAKR